MQNNYKNCQSCGMPLSRDEKGGGAEANGKKSSMYCCHCYDNGKFTLPNIAVDEMKERVINKMIEMKFPKFMARIFTRNIHKLERWKNK
ncbi:MAG TPA: zinc ribbon domain-containing protein [Clostridium sp.]